MVSYKCMCIFIMVLVSKHIDVKFPGHYVRRKRKCRKEVNWRTSSKTSILKK
jgi:hypothetical protein